MRVGATFIPWVLSIAPGAIAQDDVQHTGTFEEALAHHSGADLRRWREAHPWSLGDRLAGFFDDLLATRKVGERQAIEHADLQAAFLAESIAEDPHSGWIIQVLGWDAEACARQETLFAAVAGLPGMIAAGEADAAWSGIADLRDHAAPPGGWALCAPALARTAAAFLHAGDGRRARELAAEIATGAEDLRQGSVLAACERVLGQIALEAGDLATAERRISRSFEIRAGLDSGSRGALPDEIEVLERCEIDTLLEIAIGEKETLVVVAGTAGRTARLLPVGRAAIEELVRRLLDPATFDEKAARELHGMLLRPFETQLGARVGIVPHGILSSFPLEMLVGFGRDHATVYLSRPPLGGAKSIPRSGAAKGSFLISGEASRSPVVPWLKSRFAPVRSIDPKTAGDLMRVAAGAKCIHFEDSGRLDFDGLRGQRLDADLVVFAGSAAAEVFHAAGVQDVVASLWPVEPEKQVLLLRFYERLAGGESAPEAMRAARRELIDGSQAAGIQPVGPRLWAAWVVHRRF